MQDQLGRGQTEVEIHATAMPRPEGVTQRASGTGRARQSHTSGTVDKGVQDQLGRGQTEVEIYATAMPRLEGVTPRASNTGRARQNHTSGTVH